VVVHIAATQKRKGGNMAEFYIRRAYAIVAERIADMKRTRKDIRMKDKMFGN